MRVYPLTAKICFKISSWPFGVRCRVIAGKQASALGSTASPAHNVALTWKAGDQRRIGREEPLSGELPASPSAELSRLALAQAVARLPPADRAVVVLWLEGLSATEIEEVTGVNAAAVAMRLSRIRRKLASLEVNV